MSTVLNTNKTLIGSVNRAINFSKVYGYLCLKEIYLLNIINKLINESVLEKSCSELRKLESLSNNIQNKTYYICKIKDRHINDYHNIINFNLNSTVSNVSTNTAPTVSDNIIDYDTSFYEFTIEDFSLNYFDNENEPLTTVRITSLPNDGELRYKNNLIGLDKEININNISYLTFTRTTPLVTIDNFTFQVSDNNINKLFSNMATMTLNINEIINLPPSQIGVNQLNLLYSETHIFTQANFTTETTPIYLDPEGDIPDNIKITSLPFEGKLKYNNINVTLNQNIPYSDIGIGLLIYESSIDNESQHQVNFNFDISDIGSHNYTSGGIFTFNVAEKVNLPATIGDGNLTSNEGDLIIFTRNDFTTNTNPPYNDPDGDIALKLRITVLPTEGSIKLNNINVSVNQEILFTDIDNSLLTYTQAVNAGGTMPNFEFEIQDAGSGQWSS